MNLHFIPSHRFSGRGLAHGQESIADSRTMPILCPFRQVHRSTSHEEPRTIQHPMADDYIQPGHGGCQHLHFLDAGSLWMVRKVQLPLSASRLQQLRRCNWSELILVQLLKPVHSRLSMFQMATLAWWYYITKFIEFSDTIFFVLRKKNTHITNLHVIHHGVMPMSVWWGVKFTPG